MPSLGKTVGHKQLLDWEIVQKWVNKTVSLFECQQISVLLNIINANGVFINLVKKLYQTYKDF